MSVRRNIVTGVTLGLIFIAAMIFTTYADARSAETVRVMDVVSADCAIAPPRGLPQPCGYHSGWNGDGIRDTGIVAAGCAFGAMNGGGPWGCAAGAVSAWGGIIFAGLD